MTSVLKSIFGGGSKESQATSTPVDLQAGEYQALRQPFANTLLTLLQGGGTPEYTGPLTEPLGGAEKSVLDYLQSNTGAGSPTRGLLDSTLAGNFLPGQPGANPFLDAAIRAAQRPTLEGLTEVLSRTLPGRFTAAGQFIQPNTGPAGGGSSAFDRAAAIATRGASNALADIATNISAGAYESERGRQTQAVQLNQQEVDTTIKNLQAQALPRLIQENGIDRALQLFSQRTQSLLQLLQTLGGVTAPVVANQQQSTSKESVERGIFPALFPFGLGGSSGSKG